MPKLPLTTLIDMLREALLEQPPAVRRAAIRRLRPPAAPRKRPPRPSTMALAAGVRRALLLSQGLVTRLELVHLLGVRGRAVQRALDLLVAAGDVAVHPPSGAHRRPRYALIPRERP